MQKTAELDNWLPAATTTTTTAKHWPRALKNQLINQKPPKQTHTLKPTNTQPSLPTYLPIRCRRHLLITRQTYDLNSASFKQKLLQNFAKKIVIIIIEKLPQNVSFFPIRKHNKKKIIVILKPHQENNIKCNQKNSVFFSPPNFAFEFYIKIQVK